MVAIAAGEKLDPAAVAATLDDKDRRLFFEILFETFCRKAHGKTRKAAWGFCATVQ